MEQVLEQIKIALKNSLSTDESLRKEAQTFLMKQCEPDPQFQLALLHLISSYRTNQHANDPEHVQMQYQAILCMKNSLARLLTIHRSRKRFSNPQNQNAQTVVKNVFTDEIRKQVKRQLLQLIQTPDEIILSKNSYDQLTLIVTLFIKSDFPANWPEMNTWLLQTLNGLYQHLNNLQLEDGPKVTRFLSFYFEVLKEQSKKKLSLQKGHFSKVAKEHLQQTKVVWEYFNNHQVSMMYDQQTEQLTLTNYNEMIYNIAAKLDKCLIQVIACGFSVNNFAAEPENNQFVNTNELFVKKLKFFLLCIEKLNEVPNSDMKQQFNDIFQHQVKTFLKYISDLANSESLLMYKILDEYIQALAQILFRSDLYIERIIKLALFALYRVLNTQIYNQNGAADPQTHSDGIGILVSPIKFKNFEKQLLQASELYRFVLDQPKPDSENKREQNRQDGARKLLELVTHRFLPTIDIDMWQKEPEYFIEHEDENYFLLEYDLDSECSMNLLSQQLIEKIIQKFYHSVFPFIKELLQQYFTGSLNLGSDLVEDALLNLVGILGKVQKEYKIPLEKRLDVAYVLNFIQQNKWENPLFKRRFVLILTNWAKILPKTQFINYFNVVIKSLSETTDEVLVNEHCHCIHEMLKEIDYWIRKTKQKEQLKDMFDNLDNPVESEIEQIKSSLQIESQINYGQVFQLECSKLVPLLHKFRAPNLIWNMINYLSFILEKNIEQPEQMIDCLKSLNVTNIIQNGQEQHTDEAIIDMFKNLLCYCPTSEVILEMCVTLINHKLSNNVNQSSDMQFWLFTMRAVAPNNPCLSQLKQLFMKFSHVLTKNVVKQGYVLLDFLKVTQEAVLLDMFQDNQQDIVGIIQVCTDKFTQEAEFEQQMQLQSKGSSEKVNGKNNNWDNDDQELENQIEDAQAESYDKRTQIMVISHICVQKVQMNPQALDFVFQQQLQLCKQMCISIIQMECKKTVPCFTIYITNLMTFVNRMIVVKPQEFCQQVLQSAEVIQKGGSLDIFVSKWIDKMDFIVSQDSRRINLLALYELLPHFNVELVKNLLPEIARISFPYLEQFLKSKINNDGARFCSPNRFNSKLGSGTHPGNQNTVKIRLNEKVSQRYEQLRSEDQLLEIDLIEHFQTRLKQLTVNLNLQSLDPLYECLQDQVLREQLQRLTQVYDPALKNQATPNHMR